jgi:hypothetical protein
MFGVRWVFEQGSDRWATRAGRVVRFWGRDAADTWAASHAGGRAWIVVAQ